MISGLTGSTPIFQQIKLAGLYLHIPFCRKACHYCDFHFSTNSSALLSMVEALGRELVLRRDELSSDTIETIYFGGGTPSLLEANHLGFLLNIISKNFKVSRLVEISIECNPEDIINDELQDFKKLGINRLSIGIQTLDDKALLLMNRNHDSKTTLRALDKTLKYDFGNLNIDLMYGMPGETIEIWKENLDLINKFYIKHISCYNLTVESRTALHHFLKKGKLTIPDDQWNSQIFELNSSFFAENGYDHYEISNFAKKDFYSLHNSNYWRGEKYLGIGPSAHSYDGQNQRSWNVSNNVKYLSGIECGVRDFEMEVLSTNNRINELIMIGCRTKWGIDLSKITEIDASASEILIKQLEVENLMDSFEVNDNYLILRDDAKLFADQIASSIFFTD
jgi:oxygen-independent coproporphyrinogen-3 oxidase